MLEVSRKHRVAVALNAYIAAAAVGQCNPQWSAYSGPQLNNGLWTVTTWDPDGVGPSPSVVIGGGSISSAGATMLRGVGMWDGSSWRSMGAGVDNTVETVTTYDPDGNGPLPLSPVIGGDFSFSGSTLAKGIAWFDGSNWQPLGAGLTFQTTPEVMELGVFNSTLLASGSITSAGGIPLHWIARWNGSTWSAFKSELIAPPHAWGLHSGNLYAGGYFLLPEFPDRFVGISRWTGVAWAAIGDNFPQEPVEAITTFRGQLIAAGYFTNTCCGHPPAPGEGIAAFNGTSWVPLGSGLNGPVRAMCVFDPDGPGPMPDLLIVGGSFTTAGGNFSRCIAAWDGSQWLSIFGAGTSDTVRCLTVWNNQLVVGGAFFSAGGLVSPGMAFWGCPSLAPCYANCDGSNLSPALNINDFMCFINRFAAADSYANCDGSTAPPALNVLDFSCFLNKFAAGCT